MLLCFLILLCLLLCSYYQILFDVCGSTYTLLSVWQFSAMWLEGRCISSESVGSRESGVKTNRGWNVFRSPIFISASQFVVLRSLPLHCFIREPGDILYQYYIDRRNEIRKRMIFGYITELAHTCFYLRLKVYSIIKHISWRCECLRKHLHFKHPEFSNT